MNVFKCPNCHGEGLLPEEVPCWKCGSGKVSEGARPEQSEPARLPCPFCGNQNDIHLSEWEERITVECAVCGVEMPGATREQAVASWNRRHPADALRGGEITLNEALARVALPPLRAETLSAIDEVRAATPASVLASRDDAPVEVVFEEVVVRGGRPNHQEATIVRHPWQASCAVSPARHFDLRAVAETPEEAAMLFGPAERMDFEEVHLIIGDRCVPWVLTPGQSEQIVAGGGVPC